MKKISKIGLAMCIISFTLAGIAFTQTSNRIGTPVSNQVAATLRGGCPGTTGTSCGKGSCGSASTYYVSAKGSDAGQKTGDTSINCAGSDTASCASCNNSVQCMTDWSKRHRHLNRIRPGSKLIGCKLASCCDPGRALRHVVLELVDEDQQSSLVCWYLKKWDPKETCFC